MPTRVVERSIPCTGFIGTCRLQVWGVVGIDLYLFVICIRFVFVYQKGFNNIKLVFNSGVINIFIPSPLGKRCSA